MIRNQMTVTDDSGAEWTIGRRVYPALVDDQGAPDVFFLYVVLWPVWFIAHWLGWPWMVDVARDGSHVSEEKVRGWRRSGRRIAEIARTK
jgi:hypothetical protein